MSYDAAFADRIRAATEGEEGLSERKMFGGLAFLVHGNMAVAAGSGGSLMLRVDPSEADALTREPHVERFEMRGRAMKGWLDVRQEAVTDAAALQRWVDVGLDYARSLPPK